MAGKSNLTKKIQGKFKKGLPKKIKAQISEQIAEKMNSKLASQLSMRLSESAQTVKNLRETATQTAQVAAESAKHSLDQVLLGLEHRGIKIKDSQELAHRVALKVLERAEAIRAQIASNPMSPAWLKDVSLTPQAFAGKSAVTDMKASEDSVTGDSIAASSLTETGVSEAAAGMQPPQMKDVVEDEESKPAKAKTRTGKSASGSATRTSK